MQKHNGLTVYCTYTWRLYQFEDHLAAEKYRDGKDASRLFDNEREYLIYVHRYVAAGKRHPEVGQGERQQTMFPELEGGDG